MKKIIFSKLKNFDDDFKNEILEEIDDIFNENNDEYTMTNGEIMPIDIKFDCNKYDEIEKEFLENIDIEIEGAIASLSEQYEIQQTQNSDRY